MSVEVNGKRVSAGPLLVLPAGYALPREAAAEMRPLIRSCWTDGMGTRTYHLNLPIEAPDAEDEAA